MRSLKVGIYSLSIFALLSLYSHVASAEPRQPETPPAYQGKTATIVGTEGNDTLNGTLGPDVIVGLGGEDTIK